MSGYDEWKQRDGDDPGRGEGEPTRYRCYTCHRVLIGATAAALHYSETGHQIVSRHGIAQQFPVKPREKQGAA